jgi:hypothetical protein
LPGLEEWAGGVEDDGEPFVGAVAMVLAIEVERATAVIEGCCARPRRRAEQFRDVSSSSGLRIGAAPGEVVWPSSVRWVGGVGELSRPRLHRRWLRTA